MVENIEKASAVEMLVSGYIMPASEQDGPTAAYDTEEKDFEVSVKN